MSGTQSDVEVGGAAVGGYVELHLHTCYSLLEGASRPEELIEQAAEYGYRTLAVTDRNNLYGAMVFAGRCRERGIRPIIGVELTLAADPDDLACARHDLTLWPPRGRVTPTCAG